MQRILNIFTYCFRETHQLFRTKKQRSLEDRTLNRAWGGFKSPEIIKFHNTTKWFSWSKTITEIGVTRLLMTTAVYKLTEHYPCRLQGKKTLFIYLSLCLDLSRLLPLSLSSLQKCPEKKRLSAKSSVSKGPLPFLSAPGYFYPLPPPIHPSLSKRTLCANLYSLSHAKHLSCPHWMPLQSNQHLSGCKAF